MAARARLLVGDPLVGYIRTRSSALNLDPSAVEAVAAAEGGFQGSVGDQGTSFGPFQLHEGGALPSGLSGAVARAWANSKAGIDYALGRIAQVAGGLRGAAAVQAIVTRFERPADGGTGDIQRASAYLLNHPASGPMRGGRSIRFTGASTAGVKPTLLASIAAAVESVGGVGVYVTSGKRAPGPGNDVSNSNHITGDALDGYVIFAGGRRVPLGTALKNVAGYYRLRSGDVAGFDPAKPGGYDPVHVDDGANVGGVVIGGPNESTPVRTRPSAGSGGFGDIVGDALGGVGGAATSGEKAFERLFGGGIGGLADVFKGLIWLMKPQSWLRMVEFVTGLLLMLFGLVGLAVVLLSRSETVGAAAEVAQAAPGPVGLAGRAVTTVRRPRQAARTVQAQRRSQAASEERQQAARQRLDERRERQEMDLHYRARADELDPRRRARAEQRQIREDRAREARENAGAAAAIARSRRRGEEVPF